MDLDEEELVATKRLNGTNKPKNNIIKFKSKTDNILEFIEELKDNVNKYKIDNRMVACKLKDSNHYVITGYKNLTMAEKQELVGHIQIDIIDEMIRNNYVTP